MVTRETEKYSVLVLVLLEPKGPGPPVIMLGRLRGYSGGYGEPEVHL